MFIHPPMKPSLHWTSRIDFCTSLPLPDDRDGVSRHGDGDGDGDGLACLQCVSLLFWQRMSRRLHSIVSELVGEVILFATLIQVLEQIHPLRIYIVLLIDPILQS